MKQDFIVSTNSDIASTILILEPPIGPLHGGAYLIANPLSKNEPGIALRLHPTVKSLGNKIVRCDFSGIGPGKTEARQAP